MARVKNAIPVPITNRLRHLVTQQMQGALFLLSVAGVVGLWMTQKPRVILTGQVETSRIVVSATRDGVLAESMFPLNPFDRVEKGVTPIAVIDVTDALLEMQTMTEERTRLQAELEAQRQRIAQEKVQWKLQTRLQHQRREQQSIDRDRMRDNARQRIDRLKTDLLDLQQQKRELNILVGENEATLRQAKIAVESLKGEKQHVDELVASKLTSGSELWRIRRELKLHQQSILDADQLAKLYQQQQSELDRLIQEAEHRIETATEHLAQIQSRWANNLSAETPAELESPETLDEEGLLEPFVQAIAVQDARIRVLANQIASNQIAAPSNGSIAEIHQKAGNYVRKGDPIATIASGQARWIVAYVDGLEPTKIEPSTSVQIRIGDAQTFVTTSTVEQIGTQFEPVPTALRDVPNVDQWGVPIKVPIPEGVELIPGQLVQLVIQ